MLTQLSTSSEAAAPDLVQLLSQCHQRIRRFVALAREVATRTEVPLPQVVQACAEVERYFQEALPLHVADEEESIAPHLRGLSPEVDEALEAMAAQHQQHAAKLESLLRALVEVRSDPGRTEARAALGTAAQDVERAFAEHLALEERVLFPSIRERLPPKTQARLIDELRQRRRPSPPPEDQGGTK